MGQIVDIRAHDALFATRTTPEDWARIAEFRDRPAFLDGIRQHEGAMQPFFAHNLILNRVVTEAWRFQILVFTLYLHNMLDHADPRSGLTVSNLQKICAQKQLASAGRAYAFLNIMKVGGYLASARSTVDSRVVRLEPTPRFMAIVEEWNDHIFASIDATTPAPSLLAARARYPDLGRGMRTSGAQGMLDGWLPLEPWPETVHFISTDGGWLLIEYLVLCSMRSGTVVDVEPVSLDLRSTASRFGGSRSNLLRLLESGHELGLLDAPPRGGKQIILSSRMICSFLGFMASYLGYFEIRARLVLDGLAAERQARAGQQDGRPAIA